MEAFFIQYGKEWAMHNIYTEYGHTVILPFLNVGVNLGVVAACNK
jgi:hypothetical protein